MYAEILFSKQAAGCDIRIILYNYNYRPPSESRGVWMPRNFSFRSQILCFASHMKISISILILPLLPLNTLLEHW